MRFVSAPSKKIGVLMGMMLGSGALVLVLKLSDAINATTAYLLTIVPVALTFLLFLTALGAKADRHGCRPGGGAQRRYIKRVGLFTALYLLSFGVMTFAMVDSEPGFAMRALLSTLPGLAVIGMFWAIARLIVEEQDEFMRMLVVRQSLIATGIALSAATIWGFLEAGGVVPHLDAYWVAIAWFAGLGVGALFNRIEYGTWGAI